LGAFLNLQKDKGNKKSTLPLLLLVSKTQENCDGMVPAPLLHAESHTTDYFCCLYSKSVFLER